LIAPPEYKVEVVTLEKAEGTKKIEEAIAIIEDEIKKRNGTFKLLTKV
jgi:translation initiation factor 2 alpha subunit (eIF-2alpha)